MNTSIKVNQKAVIYDTLLIGRINIHEGVGSVHVALTGEEVQCPLTYNVEITPEEYNLWGTDDTYIEDLVLSKLGFSRA